MIVDRIIGTIDDEVCAGRCHHVVEIGWGDATKHRQRVVADTGVEIAIVLPRGIFLRDGIVLAGANTITDIVVVRRPAEPALSVRFGDHSGMDGARRMLLLGYQLGNQHAPIDISPDGVAAPLFTGADAARQLLADLGVRGEVGTAVLAADGWAGTSADQHAGHTH